MEDQQTEPGDLTPERSDAGSDVDVPQGKAARRRHRLPRHPTAVTSSTDEETGVEESGIEESDTDESDTEEPETGDAEPELAPHQPVGRRLVMVGVAAGVLFVGATAFSGAMLQPYLAYQALTQNRFDVAKTAADAVSTLWTYTPQNMDSLGDRSQRFLSGRFAEEYRKFVDSIVATNKQAQVTNETKVVGAAVETIGPTEATAIVYANSVATSPLSKNVPSLRYLSYRLTLQRHGSDWLVTRMPALTQLDLTPQL